MSHQNTRRTFLTQGAVAGAVVGLGDLGFLSHLRPVGGSEAKLDPNTVKLDPEIEPLVRLIEETPRERLLEEVASRIHGDTSYRELLAALLLAGVKNVEPRPSVGHKFHAVLVVNSAHLASMSSPPEHRWLPIFWALDYYKSAAAQDVRERGDWTMQAVDEAAVPVPHKAPLAFTDAMNGWDEQAADPAVVGLARSTGAQGVYEHLFRYGMRDFRSIGHKAIYVANSLRTLQCIGWQHSEPVLRSLAYALLAHEGDNPKERDHEADRPYRRNLELVGNVRQDWAVGEPDPAATSDLLETLRTGSNDDVCDEVLAVLERGVSPQSVWDALHVGAGELLMRQPAIVALHAVTTTNAMHYAYLTSGNNETRLLALLQNAAFLPMFREAMQGRGDVRDITVNNLQPKSEGSSAGISVAEVFELLGEDRDAAASLALSRLQSVGEAKEMIDAARLVTFLKGNNAHDYKFSSAVLEDYYLVSPEFRNQFFASNLYQLRSSQEKDNQLVERTRAALIS
ncbi:MAG: twin-arginine translocation signal domain-containing protein [Pirellulales bacterium]